MKNAFSCLLALLCPFLSLLGQSSIINPLTIGDAVPDLVIGHLVQYKAPVARISTFKDKVLILDLMTSRCGSCIEHLQHWDSLQTRYSNQLQILPVTYESPTAIKSFLQTVYGKSIRFPFATLDTTIRRLFPHQFISHLVWIYKGRVQAITHGEYVTAQNIETLLQGKKLDLPLKKDVGYYDPSIPLWVANPQTILPENAPGFRSYSSLIPYMDGFSFGQYEVTDTIQQLHRSTFLNWPIEQLYRYALGQSDRFPNAFIRYEVKDSSRFFFNPKGYWSEWYTTAYTGYQSSLPLSISDTLRNQRMLADLDFFLRLQGRMEKRTIRCIILRPDTTIHPLPPRPTGDIVEIFGLALLQNDQKGATPLFVEMNGDDQRYVPRPTDYENIPALQTLLRPYGIRVTEEQRELKLLVLSDAPSLNP